MEKHNNENKFYTDEILSPPEQQEKNDTNTNKNLTSLEVKKENLIKAFTSGPGLIILIVSSLIIIIFIAIAVRTLTGNKEQLTENRQVESPETPIDSNLANIPVTPEEALRRQQIANSEAIAAAASGASYQPGFDINMTSQNNINNEALNSNQSASMPMNNSAIQFTAEQQAEMKRLEDERKLQEAARQQEMELWQKANEQRNSYVEQQKALIADNISKILGGNGGNEKNISTTISYLPANNLKNKSVQPDNVKANPSNQEVNKKVIFRTGNTIFAVLDSEVNTDSGNLAIATVHGGEYNGSKLIGQITHGNGNIELKFNKLAPQDGRSSLVIDGLAMRVSDASTGVATSINKHTLSRYASLLFSSALTGLGQAAQQQDSSVTQLNNGTTVSTTHSATDKQIIGYVTGNIGSAISNEIGQNFNRRPTYKIARGTGIAVFMLSDVLSN